MTQQCTCWKNKCNCCKTLLSKWTIKWDWQFHGLLTEWVMRSCLKVWLMFCNVFVCTWKYTEKTKWFSPNKLHETSCAAVNKDNWYPVRFTWKGCLLHPQILPEARHTAVFLLARWRSATHLQENNKKSFTSNHWRILPQAIFCPWN